MKRLLFMACILLYSNSYAQKNYVHFSGSPTLHGAGDILGFKVTGGYGRQVKKWLGYEINIASTTNRKLMSTNMKDPIVKDYIPEYRVVTSGTQLELLARMPIVNRRYKLALVAGGIGRYETSSLPYDLTYSVLNPLYLLQTFIEYKKPLDNFSLGYCVELENGLKLSKNWDMGIRVGLQRDIEGHVILKAPLLLRYNFNN